MDPIRGLPARAYTDPAVFAAESERVLRSEWIPVARVADLAEPGDHLAYEIAGEPVLLVRQESGELAALSNVCRHRGMAMLEGRGCAPEIRCGYHLWTYGLDGSLRQAPHMAGPQEFDRRAVRLPRFRVEEWQGWAMVCLDPQAPPLAPRISSLTKRCADLDLAAYRTVASLSVDTPWNWKLQVENFSESYHHAGTHPDSLEPLFPGRRSEAADNGGEPWFWLDHTPSLPDLGPLTVVGLLPLLLFSLDEYCMVWLRLRVNGIAAGQLDVTVLEHPDRPVPAEAFDGLIASIERVTEEDNRVLARAQAGMRSRVFEPGPLSYLEKGTAQFHAYLSGRLGARTGEA